MIESIIYSVCFVALAVASYTDLKTREVPDWLSYSLIVVGFGIRIIASIVYSEASHILEGVTGFAIFLALALFLFYTGLWGGGDSKILMGLGALLGVKFVFLPFIALFFIMTLLVGSLYGFFYSLILALRNRAGFARRFRYIINHAKVLIIRRILVVFFVFSVVFYFFTFKSSTLYLNVAYAGSVFLIFLVFFLWVFSKAVEESCMYKLVPPEKLTEGDWIVKDVIIEKKRICGPKDLGIEKKQIEQLIKLKKQQKIKHVLIKEGIPFMPVFFIGFVTSLLLKENILALLMGLL